MNEFIIERPSRDGKHITYKVQVPYYKEGKRYYFSASFSSKKFGSKKLALEEAKKERDRLKYLSGVEGINIPKKHTAKEVLEMKFELFPSSKETERKQRIYFKANIEPFARDLPFNEIKSTDIQKSLNSMVKSCSNDTINRVFSIWKQLYKTAIMHDIVTTDYTIKVVVPEGDKITKKRKMETSKEQLEEVCKKLLETQCKDKEIIVDALWVMYYTGMRPNEVYALDYSNIDRVNKTITIEQAVGSNSTLDRVIKKTKNKNSVRVIPYSSQLEAIWERYNEGLIFIRKNGKLLDGRYVSGVLRKVSEGKFRTYQLRHQFASDLVAKGVDLKTIQTLMGHKDGSMTIEYARSDFNSLVSAIKSR